MAVLQTADYAVTWRDAEGRVASGRLALEGPELLLRGTGDDGAVRRGRVPLEQITSVRIGRAEAERVRGERSVVLELHGGDAVTVAPLGAAGAVFELADLVADLASERRELGSRVAVVLPLRPGAADRVRELVAGGPPFDLEHAELDGHHVFVTEDEAIFLFEGERARETLERLVRDPHVLWAAARWRNCLSGRPRLADESYSWRRHTTT